MPLAPSIHSKNIHYVFIISPKPFFCSEVSSCLGTTYIHLPWSPPPLFLIPVTSLRPSAYIPWPQKARPAFFACPSRPLNMSLTCILLLPCFYPPHSNQGPILCMPPQTYLLPCPASSLPSPPTNPFPLTAAFTMQALPPTPSFPPSHTPLPPLLPTHPRCPPTPRPRPSQMGLGDKREEAFTPFCIPCRKSKCVCVCVSVYLPLYLSKSQNLMNLLHLRRAFMKQLPFLQKIGLKLWEFYFTTT